MALVDIHSHILPFVDDGAPTMEAALAMLRMAAQDGISDIVASPHASPGFRCDPAAAKARAAELQAICDGQIRIHTGCELHVSSDNIRDVLRHPSRYTINNRNYLLLEFPDLFVPSGMDGVLRELLAAGITPIVAHPERNCVLQDGIADLRRWTDMNCLTQLTAQSVLGSFGRRCRNAAARLIREGLVHFVASDAHDALHRPPLLSEAYRRVRKEYGAEHAAALFEENPRAALSGGPVKRLPEATTRSFWSRLR